MDATHTNTGAEMTRTIEWQTSTGAQVIAALTLHVDGYPHASEWHASIDTVVTLDGKTMGCEIVSIRAQMVNDITLTGKSGGLGIPSAQMDKINTAKAEMLATAPKRQTYDHSQYDATRAQIARANAGTY